MCAATIKVQSDRVRRLSDGRTPLDPSAPGGVVYWMDRDQRVQDNWALLYARQLAEKHGMPLSVCYCLAPSFGEASIRQCEPTAPRTHTEHVRCHAV